LTNALLDNDVLLKAARYRLITPLLANVPLGIAVYHILGSAAHIVRKKLKKNPPACGLDEALAEFDRAAAALATVEPTREEIEFAARLELRAQRLNLPLDQGESILCAILALRGYDYLLTGDKRAIGAIEALLPHEPTLNAAGKLVCLEQLFLWYVSGVGVEEARSVVCAEKAADRTLSICFACNSAATTLEACCAGLKSYIAALRATAPTVLLSSPTGS